ncbi:UNVERIFIED_CONTAM: hypothetical protein FKN15_039399 [Acipenser sinensis]
METSQRAESREFQYPAELRSAQARKHHKLSVLRENPECLYTDYSGTGDKKMTQHLNAWHTAVSPPRSSASRGQRSMQPPRTAAHTSRPRSTVQPPAIRPPTRPTTARLSDHQQQLSYAATLSCAALPNVHLAHHPTVGPWHLYDKVHLNQEGVKVFAKTLKDAAMGRSPASPPRSSASRGQRSMQPPRTAAHTSRPHSHPPSGPPLVPLPPGSTTTSSKSAMLQLCPSPAPTELGEIKQLLSIICSRLLN